MKQIILSILIAGFLFITSHNKVYACEHPVINTNTPITTITIENGDLLKKGLQKGLISLANDFVREGINNNIDPLILSAISAHESGWGTSKLSKTHNNIFGITHKTKKWSSFNSLASCIKWTANMFDENYIKKGHNTLQKIQKTYCPDNPKWDDNIAKIANEISHQIYCVNK